MPHPPFIGLSWATAAVGVAPTSLPLDADAMGEHLRRCRGLAGRGFALRCGAEAVHGFVGARLITTLLVMLALLGCTAWLLA